MAPGALGKGETESRENRMELPVGSEVCTWTGTGLPVTSDLQWLGEAARTGHQAGPVNFSTEFILSLSSSHLSNKAAKHTSPPLSDSCESLAL